jgi:hypothetical protein
VNNGAVTSQLSKTSHHKDVVRAHGAADIHAQQVTHLYRKIGPLWMRTKYSTDKQELQDVGLWELKVMTKCYAMLPAADALANMADFMDRASYYTPRSDLHPDQFPDFSEMVEDSPFRWAHSMLAELVKVSWVTVRFVVDACCVLPLSVCAAFLIHVRHQMKHSFGVFPSYRTPWVKKWVARGMLLKWCKIQLAYCRHMDSYTEHCKRTMGAEAAAVAIRRHRDEAMPTARSGVILSRTMVCEGKEPISAVLATKVSCSSVQGGGLDQ